MKWTHLLLVILLSALIFGGSFTCKSHDDKKRSDVVVDF
jgi:hypothetical protein